MRIAILLVLLTPCGALERTQPLAQRAKPSDSAPVGREPISRAITESSIAEVFELDWSPTEDTRKALRDVLAGATPRTAHRVRGLRAPAIPVSADDVHVEALPNRLLLVRVPLGREDLLAHVRAWVDRLDMPLMSTEPAWSE